MDIYFAKSACMEIIEIIVIHYTQIWYYSR